MMKLLEPLRKRIGTIVVILILLIVVAYCNLVLPQYTADIVDIGIRNTDLNYIMNAGFWMLLIVFTSVISTIFISFLSSRVSSGFARDLRVLVYEKVLKFSNNEINEISKASLITRSTNDISQIQNISEVTLTTIIYAPILGIGSIIKVFEINSTLSWIVLAVLVVLTLIQLYVVKFVVPYFETFQELSDELTKNSREILIGMPVVKSFVRQDFEERKIERINERFTNLILYIYKFILLLNPLMTLILNLMIVAIIYFGAFQAIDGKILTGDIIAFIQYVTQLVTVFVLIANFMVIFPKFVISGKRVNEILETEVMIKDGNRDFIEDNPTIEFRNVAYKYPGSEKEAVKDINFKLEPGKTTAIIGGTGSGKSTILNLIPRLQDPTSGEILINGNNIKNYTLDALRGKISLTSQNALLLHGTVKENLLMANKGAADEEIERALKNANVNFIEGVDDEVAQGGSNFSGGQKQRLSIARAFITPSDFYLFDDCFSALDMNTEKIVKDNLKNLNDSSILIVSQRISTIMDADEIIVIDNGVIVDKGSHDNLVESCEIYREIVDSQFDSLGGI